MKLSRPNSEVYVYDALPAAEALARTTHLGIGAHPDDLEIMAIHGILECFRQPTRWFSGVVVTDGAGSAREGEYGRSTDDEMKALRRIEQKKAAFVGEYAAQVLLDHPSRSVKDASVTAVLEDLKQVIEASSPEIVYTHSLADKHDTHVAVVLRVIEALRALPFSRRPKKVIGCEVWRDLDWLRDDLKVALSVDGREHLQAALLGVFDSQIAGGKRYDLATLGRRKAHATFNESHDADRSSGMVWGMDLTPLLDDPSRQPAEVVEEQIEAFRQDVVGRIRRL